MWDGFSVVYNISSGNTYLIENIPNILMELYFKKHQFDEKEIRQNCISIDEQLITNSLNSFVKMDLLEKVEN